MKKSKFKGTGVAIITPFHSNGCVDFQALKNLVNYIIDNGINYIVVLGTTGEAATMNIDEKKAVVNYLIETVNNRVPIVMGLGGNNTSQIVSDIKNTDLSNIDALLSVTPYYNKPNQKGIYYHYKEIATASPIPIILYNVPGRTSSNISAETTLKLAHDFENIVAIKEASGNLDQIGKIIQNKPKDFIVLSGDDAMALPLIAMGASGVISVVANAFPKQFTILINQALEGNFAEARKHHYQLVNLVSALFEEGNPAGIKAALSMKNLVSNHLRLPLVKTSTELYHKIEKLIQEIE